MGNLIHRSFFSQGEAVSKQEEVIQLDPAKSHLLAFCINKQTIGRHLDNTVVNDAHLIVSSLEDISVLQEENSKIITASANPDKCTLEGMETVFKERAKKVRDDGAFFFYFAGHGRKDTDNTFSLVPMDNDKPGITANMLKKWLQEAECKAKYIILILDCCYAGGIIEDVANVSFAPHVTVVMAACTANEVSFGIQTLGNSIFSYFLSHAISNTRLPQSNFPVMEINDRCKALTKALASLLVTLDENGEPQPEYTVQPRVEVLRPSSNSKPPNKLELLKLLDHNRQCLHEKSLDWLDSCGDEESGGLVQLKNEGFLEKEHHEVLSTIINYMMRSVCKIQLRWSQPTANEIEVFQAAYNVMKATIEKVQPDVKFNKTDKHYGLVSYIGAIPHYLTLGELRKYKYKLEQSN